jgi:hypothetical protein
MQIIVNFLLICKIQQILVADETMFKYYANILLLYNIILIKNWWENNPKQKKTKNHIVMGSCWHKECHVISFWLVNEKTNGVLASL